MATLEDVRRLVALDHGLATVSTVRPTGDVQSTVVNAGVVAHPVTGEDVVGFVARAATRKVAHLRARPAASVVWRAGWAWVTVEGTTELCGPDDELKGVDGEGRRLLLRAIFTAAGGDHEDWAEYDRVMAAERRTAVLVTPRRIYQNP
jgi:PPOX class probable F420-dependent enzyme